MAKTVPVAHVDDIPPGEYIVVDVNDHSLLIVHHQGTFYAVENRCTHEDLPLEGGNIVDDTCIECPWHGAIFDLRTGEALALPAVLPLRTYPVTVQDGQVFVTLEEE